MSHMTVKKKRIGCMKLKEMDWTVSFRAYILEHDCKCDRLYVCVCMRACMRACAYCILDLRDQ